jgi:hypothetical protein
MKLSKRIYRIIPVIFFLLSIVTADLKAQPVPGKDENIYFLVTFGKAGKTSWGDPNFHSVWFFNIPTEYKKPFYIRVYDPDCGGEYDEIQGDFDTNTLFSIYGGKDVDPEQNKDSQGVENGSNFKRGNLLASKTFGTEARYDNKYYTFGPFNPADGDFNAKSNSNVFKIVCEGVKGDDGNLYKYFLSSDPNSNIEVEGANAFTYAYTFRMWNDFSKVAHIYPYIDEGVAYVTQKNFDWDNDGTILVISRYRSGWPPMHISNEDDWAENTFGVNEEKEVKSSLDFQFSKRKGVLVKNNNVQIQLWAKDKALKFYSSPIGGVPKFETEVKRTPVKPVKK